MSCSFSNETKPNKMTTSRVTSFRTDSENVQILDSFCLFESIINGKRTSSQEICCRQALRRVAVKALEKIFSFCAVSTYKN